MVRTLVLVRHGKAEKAQDDSSDLYRELTPDGRHALEIAYPRTFSLLEDYDDVNVWSSPAIRAMQTAQVVASVLGVDGIEVDQTLYDQNYDALLGQIATTPEETVVVVGHVPSLDAIASHLLGRQVRLSKGAAIALELPQPAPAAEGEAAGSTPALPSSASLLWFVDGPKSSAWGSLVSIEGEVTASAGELAAEAERFFANPDDVDALCDFRMESKKQAERADKILRNLLDATARLRGIDIFSQTVDDLVEAGELGENSLLPVACAHERKLERSSFMELVRKKGLVKKLDALVEELSSFRWKKSVLARGLSEEDLRSRFDEELDALDQALFGLDLSSANARRARADEPVHGRDSARPGRPLQRAHQRDAGRRVSPQPALPRRACRPWCCRARPERGCLGDCLGHEASRGKRRGRGGGCAVPGGACRGHR